MPIDFVKQAEELARIFFTLSNAVNDFRLRPDNFNALPPDKQQQLKDQAQALAMRGQQYTADALAAILQAIQPHLQDIKQATQGAKEVLAHLNNLEKGIGIVNAAVALVGSIVAGDAGSIGDSVQNLIQAISNRRCRVLLYSDEPLLAKDLQFALRLVEGFEVMPTCITVGGLIDQIGQRAPDVVLVALTPEITIAVLREIKGASAGSKIVLWVNTISTKFALEAMRLGVRGILRKTLATDLQVACVKKVRSGELWFEKALTDSFLHPSRAALTARERKLVSLLSQNLATREIAATLMISEGALNVDLSRLYQKVGVKDRPELALLDLKTLTGGPSLIPDVLPVQFYSCFISHSTKDQEFAVRLHADLQATGVSCWFAPHDMKGGDRVHDQIERAIEVYDRLLLLLSEASVASKWVETEMRKAFAREKHEARRVLFPISLVPFEQIETWNCFDNDSGEDLARKVREYFIPDFSNWKDRDSYQAAFQRLLRDLKVPH